jgi:hypothetical protein
MEAGVIPQNSDGAGSQDRRIQDQKNSQPLSTAAQEIENAIQGLPEDACGSASLK